MDTMIGPSDLRYIVMCLQVPPNPITQCRTSYFSSDKVEQAAGASFIRARQQVQRTKIACGFDAQEPIVAGFDSQYNRLQSASDTTPMQTATQVSTFIIVMQTKQKKIIGMREELI